MGERPQEGSCSQPSQPAWPTQTVQAWQNVPDKVIFAGCVFRGVSRASRGLKFLKGGHLEALEWDRQDIEVSEFEVLHHILRV